MSGVRCQERKTQKLKPKLWILTPVSLFLDPRSEIRNPKSLHAYFCKGVHDSIDFRKNLLVGKVPNLGSPTGAVG